MKLRGIVKEDLYYIEESVTSHVRELLTKERLEKVVFKYASKGTKGVYNKKEELFVTETGDELCIPLACINIEPEKVKLEVEPEKVKFEVEIKKSALGKLREFMFNCDLDPGSDEDMIQELFFMTSLRREVDVRDSVNVNKIS